MRVWVRTSRRTGVSLGPVALVILLPVFGVVWLVYAAALLVYFLGWLLVQGIEAIARHAENRQAQRRLTGR